MSIASLAASSLTVITLGRLTSLGGPAFTTSGFFWLKVVKICLASWLSILLALGDTKKPASLILYRSVADGIFSCLLRVEISIGRNTLKKYLTDDVRRSL